jgi:hypothetical protein
MRKSILRKREKAHCNFLGTGKFESCIFFYRNKLKNFTFAVATNISFMGQFSKENVWSYLKKLPDSLKLCASFLYGFLVNFSCAESQIHPVLHTSSKKAQKLESVVERR